MIYCLADIAKARGAGIDIRHRLANEDYVVLSERDLRTCPGLTGTVEERCKALGGEPLGRARVYYRINRKGKFRMERKG